MRCWFLIAWVVVVAGCIPRHLEVGVKDRDNDGFYGVYWCQPGTIDAYAEEHGYCVGGGDCDDYAQAVNPAAEERCGDEIDNDCDGVVDDTGIGAQEFHRDGDGDGAGDPDDTVEACTAPVWYVSDDDDCNDEAEEVHPGAQETCNDVDDDCNDVVDDGAIDASTWYFDGDDDGYGLTAVSIEACDEPESYTALPGDCNDADNDVHPGAQEVCNGIDDDCDNDVDDEDDSVDLGTATDWFVDGDDDGVGAGAGTFSCGAPSPDHVTLGDDCDDAEPLTYPNAPELCDGIDNDCDESIADEAGRVSEEYPSGDWVDITLTLPGAGNPYVVDTARTVWFCDGTFDPAIRVTSADVQIRGRNFGTTLSGLDSFRPVSIEVANGRVDVDQLNVVHGSAVEGGGLRSQAGAVELHLNGVTFVDNQADSGGGLWFGGGTLITDDAEFYDNVARVDGGGAYIASVAPGNMLAGSWFLRNEASTGNGGGLAVADGDLTLQGTLFDLNVAVGQGGGLYLGHTSTGSVEIDGCGFGANEAGAGGAMYSRAAAVHVSATSFTNNTSTGSGGAIAKGADGGPLEIDEGSSFVSNTAGSGGALYVFRGGSVTVRDTEFTSNQATLGSGGAVQNEESSIDFVDCAIHGNSASANGGGIVNFGGVTVTCTGSDADAGIYGNTAMGRGGALSIVDGATATVLAGDMGGGGGTGDNAPEDVYLQLPDIRVCYPGVATFACNEDACTPTNSCP